MTESGLGSISGCSGIDFFPSLLVTDMIAARPFYLGQARYMHIHAPV
jgi:hypothetical protein